MNELSKLFDIDFDRFFNHMERFGSLRAYDLLRQLERENAYTQSLTSYPPANIIQQSDDEWRIELAVAGFKRDQLTITKSAAFGRDLITIEGKVQRLADDEKQVYARRGIAAREFRISFTLPDHSEVMGANLEDGMLTIDLKREIPEIQKPKMIEIAAGPPALALKAPLKKLKDLSKSES